ncbi:unnamed protein product [Sphagnum balticum]
MLSKQTAIAFATGAALATAITLWCNQQARKKTQINIRDTKEYKSPEYLELKNEQLARVIKSGVKRIRIVDFDRVSLSSLNRHSFAVRADVGTSKV